MTLRYYNQNELVQYMKRQGKFMTAKEIAQQTRATQQTVSRKLNKLTPRVLEKKVRKVKSGKQMRRTAYYRFKK